MSPPVSPSAREPVSQVQETLKLTSLMINLKVINEWSRSFKEEEELSVLYSDECILMDKSHDPKWMKSFPRFMINYVLYQCYKSDDTSNKD